MKTRTALAPLLLGLVLTGALLAAGCGSDSTDCATCPKDALSQTSPDSVLLTLQRAYRTRDIDAYVSLLADDFEFHPDPSTRDSLRTALWHRDMDSTATGNMFSAPIVANIQIDLTYSATPAASGLVDHPDWVRITVINTNLEIEEPPRPGETEGLTLLVHGQQQVFWFRQGRTAADTTAASPTADLWYVTRWDDQGASTEALSRFAPRPATESTTWSAVKALFR